MSNNSTSGVAKTPPDSNLKLSQNPKGVIQSGGCTNMDFEKLGELHQCFMDRWDGQDNGLTKEEFQIAVKRTVGHTMANEEVDKIYARNDSKETGLLRWSTYISCLSTSSRLHYGMADRSIQTLFSDKIDIIRKTGHRDEIICIRFIPRLQLQATSINYSTGRYVMLGREGTLTMWSINMACIGKHYVGGNNKLVPDYFIDMVPLYPSPMIAITSTDRSVVIYEFGNLGINFKYSIVGITNCITCMNYWADLRSRTSSILVWGDTAGDIHALEMNVNRLGGIFDKDDQHEIITRVVYNDLAKNKIACVKMHKAVDVHNDWVTSVKYIPENKAFLSTSRSFSPKALVYADWFGKVVPRCYNTMTSALCLDYCHIINIIVIGSLDGNIRIWDFFMPGKPINTLKAHSSPVTNVTLFTETQHVISVDKNYYVKVYDYVEGTCNQSFSGPSLSCLGKFPISGFFFNPARRQLAVASQRLAVMSVKVSPPEMAEICAHDFPVTCVCYSNFFEEIITACKNANISVWDFNTGKHKLQFCHYSTRSRFTELPWTRDPDRLEVSALTLDTNERCAVSGANDGTVNLWNFTQGVLLSHFTLPESVLVTGLAIERTNIFVSSWCSGKIYMLNVDQKSVKENLKSFCSGQKEEVNAIILIKGGLIASGSYDGTIVVIRSQTGQSICRMNPAISQFPIRNLSVDGKKNMGKEQENVDFANEPICTAGMNTTRNNPSSMNNAAANTSIDDDRQDDKEDQSEDSLSGHFYPYSPTTYCESDTAEVESDMDLDATPLDFNNTSRNNQTGNAADIIDADGEDSNDSDESCLTPRLSEENNFLTEDHSILKCVRLSPTKVMVADKVGGRIRIITDVISVEKSRKIPDHQLVYDPFQSDFVTKYQSAQNFRAYESSIESMLYLESRKNFHIKTANIVTAGAEGWIRVWSLHPKGGLKGQFLATEVLGEAVKTMATDKMNEWLITGDTRGYVKIWDLFSYCNAAYKKLTDKERDARLESQGTQFIFLRSPFLRDEASEGFRRCARHKKRPPPDTSNPLRTLKTPRLLNVFRAHLQAITVLHYVDNNEVIITAGSDCSVRLWSARGVYIGSCGSTWNNIPGRNELALRPLPRKLRLATSARSFRVMKVGRVPMWEHAVHTITSYLDEQRKEMLKQAQVLMSNSELVAVTDDIMTKPVLLDYNEGHGVPTDMRLCNVVNFNWKDPKKSQLLGMTFKPNLHHLHCNLENNPFDTSADFGQVAAYRRIQVSDISDATRMPTPPIISQIAQRRKEQEEEAERFRQGDGVLQQSCRRPTRSGRGTTCKKNMSKNIKAANDPNRVVDHESVTDSLTVDSRVNSPTNSNYNNSPTYSMCSQSTKEFTAVCRSNKAGNNSCSNSYRRWHGREADALYNEADNTDHDLMQLYHYSYLNYDEGGYQFNVLQNKENGEKGECIQNLTQHPTDCHLNLARLHSELNLQGRKRASPKADKPFIIRGPNNGKALDRQKMSGNNGTPLQVDLQGRKKASPMAERRQDKNSSFTRGSRKSTASDIHISDKIGTPLKVNLRRKNVSPIAPRTLHKNNSFVRKLGKSKASDRQKISSNYGNRLVQELVSDRVKHPGRGGSQSKNVWSQRENAEELLSMSNVSTYTSVSGNESTDKDKTSASGRLDLKASDDADSFYTPFQMMTTDNDSVKYKGQTGIGFQASSTTFISTFQPYADCCDTDIHFDKDDTLNSVSRPERGNEATGLYRRNDPDSTQCSFPHLGSPMHGTLSQTTMISETLPKTIVSMPSLMTIVSMPSLKAMVPTISPKTGKNKTLTNAEATLQPEVAPLPGIHSHVSPEKQQHSPEERKDLFTRTGLVLKGFSAYHLPDMKRPDKN